jgi:enoyl-CoA hydratase
MTVDDNPAVVVRVDGRAGRMTLNRPETLNALTLEMVRLIEAALDRFLADDAVTTVVIDGAGERAFCAGGDIRSIHDAALVGDPAPRVFWAEEYRLNARMARFAKPIVSVMDGIVMGGGVGISAHNSHRVVTDRAVVAMPEVGIGFAPDVGGPWILSHAHGEVGAHVELTGTRLGPADAIYCGLADHYVPDGSLGELLAALADTDVDDAVAAVAAPPPPGRLEAARDWIDRCYAGDSMTEIVRRLEAEGGDAADAARDIATKSPTSLKVALRALRTAATLPNLQRCLEMEYRVSTTFLDTHDLVEGIRAAVVDKDRSPRWDPADLDGVSDADLDRFFAPRDDDIHLDPAEVSR